MPGLKAPVTLFSRLDLAVKRHNHAVFPTISNAGERLREGGATARRGQGPGKTVRLKTETGGRRQRVKKETQGR